MEIKDLVLQELVLKMTALIENVSRPLAYLTLLGLKSNKRHLGLEQRGSDFISIVYYFYSFQESSLRRWPAICRLGYLDSNLKEILVKATPYENVTNSRKSN